MVSLILAGKKDAARAQAAPSSAKEIAALPAINVHDLPLSTTARRRSCTRLQKRSSRHW